MNYLSQRYKKCVILQMGNNKFTFQTEGSATAASSLKSNYIGNENNCPKDGGHLIPQKSWNKLIGN